MTKKDLPKCQPGEVLICGCMNEMLERLEEGCVKPVYQCMTPWFQHMHRGDCHFFGELTDLCIWDEKGKKCVLNDKFDCTQKKGS